MDTKPISVKLVGKKKGYYQIAFPNLEIPVEVDETLYHRMKYSSQYAFTENSESRPQALTLKN